MDARQFLQSCKTRYHADPAPEEPIYGALVVGFSDRRRQSDLWMQLLFLDIWGAYHSRCKKEGLYRAFEFLPTFADAHSATLSELSDKPLIALKERDFKHLQKLATALDDGLRFDGRRAPTAWGKLLHFLLPQSVVMWDEEYVRTRYELESTPEAFVRYQQFCKRAVQGLLEGSDPRTLEENLELHRRQNELRYREPITKLLDEFAYDRSGVKTLLAELGPP